MPLLPCSYVARGNVPGTTRRHEGYNTMAGSLATKVPGTQDSFPSRAQHWTARPIGEKAMVCWAGCLDINRETGKTYLSPCLLVYAALTESD